MGSAGEEGYRGCPRAESYHESCSRLSAFLEASIPATRVPLSRGGWGGKFKSPQDTQVTPVSDPADPGEAQKMLRFPLFSVLRGPHTQ